MYVYIYIFIHTRVIINLDCQETEESMNIKEIEERPKKTGKKWKKWKENQRISKNMKGTQRQMKWMEMKRTRKKTKGTWKEMSSQNWILAHCTYLLLWSQPRMACSNCSSFQHSHQIETLREHFVMNPTWYLGCSNLLFFRLFELCVLVLTVCFSSYSNSWC